MKFHPVNQKFRLINKNGSIAAILKVVEVEVVQDPYFPEEVCRKPGGCKGCYYYRPHNIYQGGCIKTDYDCSLKNTNPMCWCEDREDGKAVKYIRVDKQ